MSHGVIHGQLDTERGTLKTYVTGFALSVILTLVAYVVAVHHVVSGKALMAVLLVLAIAQFVVQLFYFLHIGRETKPRWKLLVLFLMIIFVLIVALGSIWIMYNLNYRMSPEQMDQYMKSQAGSGL